MNREGNARAGPAARGIAGFALQADEGSRKFSRIAGISLARRVGLRHGIGRHEFRSGVSREASMKNFPPDALLDRFLPNAEVRSHHHVEINAPAEIVLATAKDMELLNLPIVRLIIRTRELMLGGAPDSRTHPPQLLAQMQSIGWVVLAEQPGREIVVGAVTQPWKAAPVFRSIPASDFRDFAEPGFVKIVWTLRADPIDAQRSVFHTETRVSTTDAAARKRFRRYWTLVSPGVELIRLVMLRPLKRAAEHRAFHPAA
jgi:hypothetical protein